MKSAIGIITKTIEEIKEQGLYKSERVITTPQRDIIDTTTNFGVINMCANNYLGLADSPRVIRAAKEAYDRWGYGLASVRFICGTQQIHKDLEAAISDFLGMEDTMLYSSCYDANGGVFEPILGVGDAVGNGEGHFLGCRGPRFADVIAADADGVPLGDIVAAEAEYVRDQAHRWFRGENIGPPGDVFLQNVILDRTGKFPKADALLLSHCYVHGKQDGCRSIYRHRRGYFPEGDLTEEGLHVGKTVNGHPHLAHFPAGHGMVRVIAYLGRKIESH